MRNGYKYIQITCNKAKGERNKKQIKQNIKRKKGFKTVFFAKVKKYYVLAQ